MSKKKRLNCPNCGAPITGIKCEYCGTQFIDFATIDMDRPFYIRVKDKNRLMTCEARVKEFNIRFEPHSMDTVLYVEDKPFYHPSSRITGVEMELKMESVVQDENGILYEVMEVNEYD